MIFLYIPYANLKFFLDHIISLWLPKEYLNSHNCSFDISIVKIPTILSLHVGAEAAALRVKPGVNGSKLYQQWLHKCT